MKNKKIRILLVDFGLLAIAALAWPLSSWMLRSLPPCPFPAMGFLCPACGGTRCIRNLLQGQLAAAWNSNPFFLVLIVYVAAALGLLNVGVLFDHTPTYRLAKKLLSWQFVVIAAILFAIFGIARNFV